MVETSTALVPGADYRGGDISVGLGASGSFFPGIGLLGIGYGYLPGNSREAIFFPQISYGWGYAFHPSEIVSISPALTGSSLWPVIEESDPLPSFGIAGRLSLDLHLKEGQFLSLFVKTSYFFDPIGTPVFSLGCSYSVVQQFMLPVKPPDLLLTVDPPLFSPDSDGVGDILTIVSSIRPGSSVDSASLEIFDQSGALFRRFDEIFPEKGTILWDGYSDDGELVSSTSDYVAVLEVEDLLGRRYRESLVIEVDVLVILHGDGYKIRIPNIQFPPDSADLSKVSDPVQAARNRKIIHRLVEIFRKFPQYRIQIAGHANADFYRDAEKMEIEQEEVLIPLSLARAQVVKDLLVEQGISPQRLSVIGRGASEPLVPFSSPTGRWKNRRVEFLLEKEPLP